MFKFKHHIVNSVKLCRKLWSKSYSPKSDLNNPSKFLLGCGTLGLTLGIIYIDFNKQKIYCKEAKDEEVNVDQSIQAPNTPKPLDVKQKTFVSLNEAIEQSKILIERFKIDHALPGIVVGVSINGKNVWSDGFGLSDLENKVACHKGTVMRIASISKSLTMIAAAKLWEEGKLDWDKSILSYLPNYPQPKFEDKAVTITPGQLASHLGGIRHYQKTLPDPTKPKPDKDATKEFDRQEYFIKEHYDNVTDALKLFQNDPLLVKPGEKYLYSTHGYTLLSAIIESVAKEPFDIHMLKLFRTLGLENTYLERNDPLIYNRSRYYKLENGVLLNTAYVDNSYKWAGGGFLSTVGDLLKFGNIMLYSAQHDGSNDRLPGFLKSDTVAKLWEPVIEVRKTSEFKYGMGWQVLTQQQEYGYCRLRRFLASHSGGAIGASSFLLILPRICFDHNEKVISNGQWETLPQGVIVAILTNVQQVSCSKLATDIAQLFDDVDVKN